MHAVLTNGAIVLVTVVAMEAGAWAAHKYIMHGWGWGWHASHHSDRSGLFEKNDLFALIFGLFACALIACGSAGLGALYWVGIGLTVYGILYFVLHDGLVHHRWPLRHTPRHSYLRRLVQAHRLHHATRERDGAVSFGFLYAPPVRRLAAQLKRRSGARL